jgi:hypothetical protein
MVKEGQELFASSADLGLQGLGQGAGTRGSEQAGQLPRQRSLLFQQGRWCQRRDLSRECKDRVESELQAPGIFPRSGSGSPSKMLHEKEKRQFDASRDGPDVPEAYDNPSFRGICDGSVKPPRSRGGTRCSDANRSSQPPLIIGLAV